MRTGAGLGVTALVHNDDLKPFIIPLFSLVGAFVGYEVSHQEEFSAWSSSETHIQPQA